MGVAAGSDQLDAPEDQRAMNKIRLTLSAVVTVLASVGLLACEIPGRRANTFEFGYKAIATNQREPDLCYKIAPDSYLAAPMNPRGVQLEYLRSSCFYAVAIRRRDPDLCDEVRPLNTFFLDGSSFNPERCRHLAENGPWPTWTVGGQQTELFATVLGYLHPSENNSDSEIVRIFSAAVRTAEFRQRAKQLPDFSKDDEAVRQQLLTLMPQCNGDNDERACLLLKCALLRAPDPHSECLNRLAERSRISRLN